jgi:hypothetical protein
MGHSERILIYHIQKELWCNRSMVSFVDFAAEMVCGKAQRLGEGRREPDPARSAASSVAWGRGDDEVDGGVRRESAQMTSSLSIAASADYGCG